MDPNFPSSQQRFQVITGMPVYWDKSCEELRWADYSASRVFLEQEQERQRHLLEELRREEAMIAQLGEVIERRTVSVPHAKELELVLTRLVRAGSVPSLQSAHSLLVKFLDPDGREGEFSRLFLSPR